MPLAQDIKKLGRYEILSKLGEGGAGVVYKANDPFLERNAALKVAKIPAIAPVTTDKERLQGWLREARLAAQLIHPNIAITYDAGIEKDLFYMALEYIDGPGLDKHSRSPDLLPKKRVLEIVYNACYALEYIHGKGYLHLDVKPSNIMLTNMGEVKVMDFGISRYLREKPQKDASKTSGTPYYMSPEQSRNAPELDAQTDVFSLGVVLYEMLSGKRPFEGDTPHQIFYKLAHEEPVPIQKHVPDISTDLEEILKRAMSKDKDTRFKTAKAFADSLLPIIKGKDSGALDKQDKKKIAYLKRLLFFRHFENVGLIEVIRISSWKTHKKKASIIQGDEDGNNIYFLVHGKASLHLNGEVKELKKGEFFGETAIMYDMPRKAKVIAATDCLVMAVNGNLLKQTDDSIQVEFLKGFYNKKILQLVEANLKLIRAEK